jgi:zinc D-Ala-D-Ala carboxypeptidase
MMDLTKKVGATLTLAECIKSETAIRKQIDNTPTQEHFEAMFLLATKVYDPLCKKLGAKLPFTSFYRSPKLNRAIGGSANSQHSKGQAIDIDVDSMASITNSVVFNAILNLFDFDQLIWEFGDSKNPAWVHVSYKKKGNRKQVLVASKVNGKTVYTHYPHG